MQIEEFALERFFARHEFKARWMFSASDCEPLAQAELIESMDAEVRALWATLRLSYTESDGHPLLREAIAAHYPGLQAANVLTAVPEEGIFLAMNALLQPGERVVALWPGYQSLFSIARSLGCTVDLLPLLPSTAGWFLDLDELEEKLRGAALFIVNFPHNPTGYLPDAGTFRQIVELARHAGVRIFSDEMYRGLEYTAEERLPSLCTLEPSAVSLGGLSKTCGLPGLRSGWLLSRDEAFLQRCRVLKDYLTICASAPGEILSIAALRCLDKLTRRCLAIIRHNTGLMHAFADTHGDVLEWIPPRAGSVAFPRWLQGEDAGLLSQRCLERQELLVVPGQMFGGMPAHFRVGLGRESFPAALAAFATEIDR